MKKDPQGKKATLPQGKTNIPLKTKSKEACPVDSSHRVNSRGAYIQCFDCNTSYRKTEPQHILHGTYSFENHKEYAVVQAGTDLVVRSLEDLIKVCAIDVRVWEVEKHTISVNSGYRKDRSVNWNVKDGVVVDGEVRDSGKILRAPLYNVKVWLKRKQNEIIAREVVNEIIKEIKSHSPKASVLPKRKASGLVYEIDMPDLHLGKLALAEETGTEYNMEIAESMAKKAISDLLNRAAAEKIDKIILPWGNDFFNVDTHTNTTTKGTPQTEETLWKKTFRTGRRITQQIVELCATVAPVDMLFVPGNHDKQRAFFLGEVMDAYFSNNKNVSIDNGSKVIKYRQFGSVLIGFAHGEEKVEKLPTLMSMDNPAGWGISRWREWHLGHYHTKKDMQLKLDERLGCTIRYLSALTGTDTWHFENMYFGSVRQATGFLWHSKDGLITQQHALGE